MKEKVMQGKLYVGNPHVLFGEREIASATPRRWFLFRSKISFSVAIVVFFAALSVVFSNAFASADFMSAVGVAPLDDMLDIGEPSSWTLVGSGGTMGEEDRDWRYLVASNAVNAMAGHPDDEATRRIIVKVHRLQITEEERRRSEEIADSVLPQVQSAMNAFVQNGLAEGNGFMGRTWYALESLPSFCEKRNASAKFCNCWNATLALLLRDKGLLESCQGASLKRLVQKMRFPEPQYEAEGGKKVFERWAANLLGDKLTMAEKNVLFRWQFYVVEHESRPWMKLSLAIEKMAKAAEEGRSRFEARRRNVPKLPESYVRDFSDFNFGEKGAPDFVEFWYDKAVAAGMLPEVDDTRLLEKARAAKTPWAGNANISVSSELFHGKRFKIHGEASRKDLELVRDVFLNGLGSSEDDCFELEFDEPGPTVMKTALAVFPAHRVRGLLVHGDGESEIDMGGWDACSHLWFLTLRDCSIRSGFGLARCDKLRTFKAQDCNLGGLEFLSGCSALSTVSLERCRFDNLRSFWAANSLCELSVPNSEEVVDLSIVKKHDQLRLLDITGCRVKNFAALRGHANLRTLKMACSKGGVESLSCLLDNPGLREVVYDKADFSPSVYMEFARAERKKSHGDNLEGVLADAVRDRDVPEIRRLCEKGVKSDDALSAFVFTNESDVEILRLLVSKASARYLTGQLVRYCALLGYGRPPEKSTYVPTNRVEIVGLLLKNGASPDEAIETMEHPAEDDFEIFKMMLPTASQKVKTELLQKNVKSFGDHDRWDRKVRGSVDRLEVVRSLLENGADPNAKNFFRNTPLENAVEYDGDTRLVKLLLDNGADVTRFHPKPDLFWNFYTNHRDDIWGTNRYELVEILLAHGFDVNAKSQSGKTPIGEVVSLGGGNEPYDLKMAELLLEHGADPNMKQGENMGSATDLAYGRSDAKEMTDLLVKFGGVVSDEAKQKKKDRKAQCRSHDMEAHAAEEGQPLSQHRAFGGRSDRICEEMDRFRDEMRKCADSEKRRELIEEHTRRMREIRESPRGRFVPPQNEDAK